MIRGLHGLFYSSAPEDLRAFMRDALRLPYTDVGGGWLIFDLPEADVGVHPIEQGTGAPAGTHDVSFYCDDIQGTVKELRSRGVTFAHDPVDHGYGWVTYFDMPGGVTVQLYEPTYAKAKPAAQKPAPKAAAKQPAPQAQAKAKPKPKAKPKAKPTAKRPAPKAKPRKRSLARRQSV